MFFCIAFAVIFIPCMLLFPIKKVGKKNLKQLKGKNFIISCNHTTNLDPIMMDLVFGKKHRILAKKELFSNKFTSACMRSLGAIPVDRSKADTRAIKEILSALNKNKRVCIFPQGTRAKTITIEEGSAKEGVALFAIRTNTPVVPMMFDRKIRAFHRTRLLIGEPIYPDAARKKDKEYQDEFANLVISKMNELYLNDLKLREEKKAKKLLKKKNVTIKG